MTLDYQRVTRRGSGKAHYLKRRVLAAFVDGVVLAGGLVFGCGFFMMFSWDRGVPAMAAAWILLLLVRDAGGFTPGRWTASLDVEWSRPPGLVRRGCRMALTRPFSVLMLYYVIWELVQMQWPPISKMAYRRDLADNAFGVFLLLDFVLLSGTGRRVGEWLTGSKLMLLQDE